MTTINGVTFNMKTLEPVGTHRNVPNEEPGSDESFITDMGYTGLVLRMTGYEKTLAKYDEVINEFMKSGAHALVHRTGWQFTIYSTQLVPLLGIGIVDNFFPYELTMLTSNPYRSSTTETSRTKTITTNNQEWSADNSANDIDTDGSVDAVPDIKVTGGAVGTGYNRDGYISDTTDTSTYNASTSGSYELEKTLTFTAEEQSAFLVDTVGMDVAENNNSSNVTGKVTYQAASLNGGAETLVPGAEWQTTNDGFTPYSVTDLDIACAGNETLTLRWYLKSGNGATMSCRNLDAIVEYKRRDVCKTPQVYNTADSTVKSSVTNEIEPDMVARINTDGTGTVEYADDFTTDKYIDACIYQEGITHDTVDDELDIADDGYIYYKTDAKYPITGVPTFTSRINITSGAPTIQISSDGVTWYDITTAIVDDVDTVYELDSTSLHISENGLTEFYWRIDCVKAAAATCSIKSFELDINIITIDAEHSKISSSGVSTYRCDQHTDSGLNCVVALVYRDRSWAA